MLNNPQETPKNPLDFLKILMDLGLNSSSVSQPLLTMRRGKKKNVMVYLDPEVVREARELGLNISRVSENALREAIRKLKG